jgi:hypothetical protein
MSRISLQTWRILVSKVCVCDKNDEYGTESGTDMYMVPQTSVILNTSVEHQELKAPTTCARGLSEFDVSYFLCGTSFTTLSLSSHAPATSECVRPGLESQHHRLTDTQGNQCGSTTVGHKVIKHPPQRHRSVVVLLMISFDFSSNTIHRWTQVVTFNIYINVTSSDRQIQVSHLFFMSEGRCLEALSKWPSLRLTKSRQRVQSEGTKQYEALDCPGHNLHHLRCPFHHPNLLHNPPRSPGRNAHLRKSKNPV